MVSQFSDKRKKFLNLFNTYSDIENHFSKHITCMFKYLSGNEYDHEFKITNEKDFNSFFNYVLIIKILDLLKNNCYGNINENDLKTLKFLCKEFKYCPRISDIEHFYAILRNINDENYEKLAANNVIDRRVKDAIMPFIAVLPRARVGGAP